MRDQRSDWVAILIAMTFVTIWGVLFGGNPDLIDALTARIMEPPNDTP